MVRTASNLSLLRCGQLRDDPRAVGAALIETLDTLTVSFYSSFIGVVSYMPAKHFDIGLNHLVRKGS